ncbi:hypothetical protein M9979_09100 [Sphingomonas sp. RP10(2022)]|uniref:Uncharacterized protein n=1 Tax=Sphingomonas liriopis TaxID=2949094 RepID=A0A9X2KPT8_9SPHN|nr:hypothetical protein [Sphingomonas liriopis]MCP3735024.1 hypothetical protein [Sphingomonas liriopis]
MIDRGLAVFSGIHPKVVDRLAPTLRSTGIDAVVVKPDDTVTAGYFERLARQTLCAANRATARGQVRLTSVLISALDADAAELETEAFFPALRRVPVPSEWRNNTAAAKPMATLVQDYFRDEASRCFTRGLAACRERRLLLPPRNTPSKALAARFRQIYHRDASDLGAKVDKEVTVQRGGRGLKVHNLQFVPTVNSDRHPVRRCTDTYSCDLKAAFRFGAPVAARFEFDLTADNGLATKLFHLCDGSTQVVSPQATHLNMRINDDFKEG